MQTPHIVVIVHVFYLHLWKELASCIRNIEWMYDGIDVFITIPEDASGQFESVIRNDFANANIKRLPNRGFDVGPFFEVLHRIDLGKYDYVIKLHTKRNCFGIVNFWPFFGGQWRRILLGFCKTRKSIARTFAILEENQDVGMVGAGMLALKPENELVGKYSVGGEGCVHPERFDSCCFIAGTMFVVRASLLVGLKGKYSFESFKLMRPGCHDACNAHGVEREFGHEIYDRGYRIGFYPETQVLLSCTIGARRWLYGCVCSIARLFMRSKNAE